MVDKKANPLFSIIMPTHNRGDVIGFAIRSVLSQTVSDFELMVISDGCTDSTEKIVEGFANKDKRIKWFSFEKGPGFGYGHRNTVLKIARGKYIAFAAHDDLWFSDHLEKTSDFFQENPDYDIVYTRPLWIHPDGTLVPSAFNTDADFVKEIFLKKHNEIPADCVVHKRESAERVSFLNPNLFRDGDWDLWRRIVLKDRKKRIGFIAAPTTIHFRANWRKKGNYWNETLEALYRKIKGSPSLKKFLKLEVEKTVLLQRSVLERYLKNRHWVKKLREEFITAALDVLSHNYIMAKAENLRLKNDLERVTGTRGYKLMEFLRRLSNIP